MNIFCSTKTKTKLKTKFRYPCVTYVENGKSCMTLSNGPLSYIYIYIFKFRLITKSVIYFLYRICLFSALHRSHVCMCKKCGVLFAEGRGGGNKMKECLCTGNRSGGLRNQISNHCVMVWNVIKEPKNGPESEIWNCHAFVYVWGNSNRTASIPIAWKYHFDRFSYTIQLYRFQYSVL